MAERPWTSLLETKLASIGLSQNHIDTLSNFLSLQTLYDGYVVPNKKELLYSHLAQHLAIDDSLAFSVANALFSINFEQAFEQFPHRAEEVNKHHIQNSFFPNTPVDPATITLLSEKEPELDLESAFSHLLHYTVEKSQQTVAALLYISAHLCDDTFFSTVTTTSPTLQSILISLLQTSRGLDIDVVDETLLLLIKLCCHEELSITLGKQKLMEDVVGIIRAYLPKGKALKDETRRLIASKLIKRATYLLFILCHQNENVQRAIDDGVTGVCADVLSTFGTETTNHVKSVCDLISLLMAEESNLGYLFSLRVIDLLMDQLNACIEPLHDALLFPEKEDELIFHISKALAHFSTSDIVLSTLSAPANLQTILSALNSALVVSPHSVAQLVIILGNITANDKSRGNIAEMKKVSVSLMKTLNRFSNASFPSILLSTLSALRNICIDGSLAAFVGSSVGITVLMRCLKGNISNNEIIASVLQTLFILSEQENCRTFLSQVENLTTFLQLLNECAKNNLILDNLLSLLLNLTTDENTQQIVANLIMPSNLLQICQSANISENNLISSCELIRNLSFVDEMPVALINSGAVNVLFTVLRQPLLTQQNLLKLHTVILQTLYIFSSVDGVRPFFPQMDETISRVLSQHSARGKSQISDDDTIPQVATYLYSFMKS
ncbi:uncharacterized protein MONOS_12817 [Monocercomonoides exilis]|uniref:uncharacterized protein n=1 Tax=Monocercomonoides exilis TaxID=2049356 RepID=UPI00355A8806|nr:hypothetical protein MONOS_12817 [Monocercomonoides exilis]|eukprot:MONOS_12817.1-p1 / transcript=MONOS_12817.1 / gene=MONOS_12817 / organism=Monocercomonoides_exilis_PA203 / gene_product=unspecified product / transcript_product=unspecified product / location=Mono_scaffold00738:324-4163(-) / protein_length=668 / sequence_SO=supercontig / SO=protein_coding / is_pseudo=false